MLGLKLYKNNPSDMDKYIEAADWCNQHNATIADKGEYYEVISIVEPALDELKTAKLAEVNAWTESKITGGFVSSCSGELVTYDSDKETQLTVSSDMSTIQLAPDKFKENYPEGYPMRGYPKGVDTSNSENKVVYYLTFEQLIQWNVDIGLHRGACKQAGWVKQTAVNNAKNIDDLNNIVLE